MRALSEKRLSDYMAQQIADDNIIIISICLKSSIVSNQ